MILPHTDLPFSRFVSAKAKSSVSSALDIDTLHRDTIFMSPLMIPSAQDYDARARSREISAAGYRQLAEFRYRIRQFLHLSEEAARSRGIEPQRSEEHTSELQSLRH